jgi:colanic acid biosynthesis glycosyl transferase WcaI
VLLLPHQPSAPSPHVTEADGDAAVGAPDHPPVGHAVVVDIDRQADPGDQAPYSAVLADHLAHRAASVDILAAPAPLPHRPELVVGFTPRLASAEAAARIARTSGARLIVVVQELRGAPVREREAEILRSACYVAIGSETFREPVRRYGVAADRIGLLPDWAHVVPTWLDRQEARRALGWPERAFIAVHIGTEEHRHDAATAVSAAHRAGPGTVLVLVGDGTGDHGTGGDGTGDHGRAHDRTAPGDVPNVLVTGPLGADQRALTLVAADVLVMTEPAAPGRLALPGELASCLAAARPVVAACVPGGVAEAELARAEGAALVVPAGAADLLADALLALRSDPARRLAMGLAGLAHAQGQLSLPRALARFDDIVDATLTASRTLPAAAATAPALPVA